MTLTLDQIMELAQLYSQKQYSKKNIHQLDAYIKLLDLQDDIAEFFQDHFDSVTYTDAIENKAISLKKAGNYMLSEILSAIPQNIKNSVLDAVDLLENKKMTAKQRKAHREAIKNPPKWGPLDF